LKDFAAIQSVFTAKLLTKRRKIKIKVLIVVYYIYLIFYKNGLPHHLLWLLVSNGCLDKINVLWRVLHLKCK
jgi:hypothetical protein